MKKYISCILFSAILIFSCSKSTPNLPRYYVSCTLNGVNKVFSDSTSCIADGQNIFMVGYLNNKVTKEKYDLTINATGSLTAGTYTDTTANTFLVSHYMPDASNGSVYYAGSPFYVFGYKHFVIHIVSLTETEVIGTFSGDLMPTQDVKTVTNGKFDLKVTH
ncbi:MAG TPA: hypothetical protein VKT28_19360 [Puia sp.]|nr:hypothetical protein [Puia sp.]